MPSSKPAWSTAGAPYTHLWITPPVLNQWWDTQVDYGGYHGYWASDFSRIDPHLGTMDDFRRLSDALHRQGMTLVPLVMYFNHRGMVKLKLGLAKGKKAADKRETSAKRDWNRQKQRLLKQGG